MKKTAGCLLLFTLFFFLYAKIGKTDLTSKNYSIAPNFKLIDLDGNEISLLKYRGKIVFLNFWATWCPPCRTEIPGFVQLYEKYKDKGMQIIGISLDRTGKDNVLNFIKKYKINYPVVLATMKLYKDYEPGRFIPTTIVIDQNGNIRYKHVGYMDKETLMKYFFNLTKD